MLRPQIHRSHSFKLPLLGTPFIIGRSSYSPAILRQPVIAKKHYITRINYACSNIKAEHSDSVGNSMTMKGVITVQPTISGSLTNATVGLVKQVVDGVKDHLGRSLSLELVAANLDSSGNEKETVKAHASYTGLDDERKLYIYECHFEVPEGFGEIGAMLIENKHHSEMYLKDVVLGDDKVTFTCESWIHSKHDNPNKRIFFTNKSYLPLETPNGLKSLREKDLESLRGNGQGERKSFERIYDYDTYDDLGDPDTSLDLARPVLGGEKYPYPRRCRTGRKMTSTEPWSESRTSQPGYVPRDEDFSEIKEASFGARTLYSVLHAVIPTLESILTDPNKGFSSFRDIDSLYDEGVDVDAPTLGSGLFSCLPRLFNGVASSTQSVLNFEIPRTMERDSFSWFRDEEFCRQTLAGVNPYSIKLITEWPLMSKLDPKVYGPPESAITKDIIEQEIKGLMTFEDALEEKKLFLLDYHDLLLPYVNKVRDLEGTTLYGSRTLMFLTSKGTLRPLAIELTRPPNKGNPQWKHVYTPCGEATGAWLWKLAKAHVLAHDSCYHELVSHWLRTHCVIEPYIIATNRHLSKMHPIERLLCPHLRYTMEINSIARDALINAGGIIESSFSLGKYSMQLSSDAYAQEWRFDHQALPADLISRGMAIEDQNAPHGIKLTIEDYPFANDGLLLWDAIKQWATTYVNHYYPQPNLVESDEELQAWWTEIRTVGHGDKKDEPWWPNLKTQQDLIFVVSTIMGMAIEDQNAPHGIKLTIEDYPFANDGLLLWDAIKQWATTYVNHYYPQPNLVESDEELQAWWTEIRTVGHGDKKDEPWWPNLKTQQDLIFVVSTIMWVASGHHSAVNFGQYDYGGYFPNRPSIARIKMPNEDPTNEEWEAFIEKPEDVLLNCFPTQIQATKVMAILDVLSSHSLDEEYIGAHMEAAWGEEPAIKVAFEEFNGRLKELEGIIDSRNNDPNLKNRNGAGLVPYQLLKPFSEHGVTGKGVPYSTSI